MNKIEIMAFCPKLLSLKNREITSYLKDYIYKSPDNGISKDIKFKNGNDWFIAETKLITIKIFKTGILEIKSVPSEHNLEKLLKIAENISINLFQSEIIYDFSIYNSNDDVLTKRDYDMFKDNDIKSFSFFKGGIFFDIRREIVGYRINVKGIKKVSDIPIICKAITSK